MLYDAGYMAPPDTRMAPRWKLSAGGPARTRARPPRGAAERVAAEAQQLGGSPALVERAEPDARGGDGAHQPREHAVARLSAHIDTGGQDGSASSGELDAEEDGKHELVLLRVGIPL